MLERKIYKSLLNWKNNSKGNTALLIDGARRVGKSIIAEEFGKNEYKSYVLIDFSNLDNNTKQLFEDFKTDLDEFFSRLSVIYKKRLYKRETLIIFDEVQQYPEARQFIKHLVKDGRFDYLETGSLIRLKKNVKDIVIPSEEEHIEMFPMDFEEFLWALDDKVTMPFVKECFEQRKPLGQSAHRKVLNLFRQYLLVGGMPKSVSLYVENSKDFEKADEEKRRILNLYREDISKFASGYEDKVYAVFDNIPGQLMKKEKKYKLSSVDVNARFRSYEDSFIWLNEAMIVNPCFNCTDPNIGLALSADNKTQKIYMADTGLLVTLAFMDSSFTSNDLYRAILFDKLNINEGMIMENYVAQALRTSGHKLYFYSRKDDDRKNTMEIDFVISEGKKISPIEVKSGEYSTHSSLDKFKTKFKKNIGNSYILYDKDLMIKDDIIHLPLYMAMCL